MEPASSPPSTLRRHCGRPADGQRPGGTGQLAGWGGTTGAPVKERRILEVSVVEQYERVSAIERSSMESPEGDGTGTAERSRANAAYAPEGV